MAAVEVWYSKVMAARRPLLVASQKFVTITVMTKVVVRGVIDDDDDDDDNGVCAVSFPRTLTKHCIKI